jgi:hypothetical protein
MKQRKKNLKRRFLFTYEIVLMTTTKVSDKLRIETVSVF